MTKTISFLAKMVVVAPLAISPALAADRGAMVEAGHQAISNLSASHQAMGNNIDNLRQSHAQLVASQQRLNEALESGDNDEVAHALSRYEHHSAELDGLIKSAKTMNNSSSTRLSTLGTGEQSRRQSVDKSLGRYLDEHPDAAESVANARLSDRQRTVISKASATFASLKPDEKEAIDHAIRSTFQSLTPGEKETIKQVAAKTINDRENEITPEQKQQAKAIVDKVWSSLTPEQQQKIKHAASVAEARAEWVLVGAASKARTVANNVQEDYYAYEAMLQAIADKINTH